MVFIINCTRVSSFNRCPVALLCSIMCAFMALSISSKSGMTKISAPHVHLKMGGLSVFFWAKSRSSQLFLKPIGHYFLRSVVLVQKYYVFRLNVTAEITILEKSPSPILQRRLRKLAKSTWQILSGLLPKQTYMPFIC